MRAAGSRGLRGRRVPCAAPTAGPESPPCRPCCPQRAAPGGPRLPRRSEVETGASPRGKAPPSKFTQVPARFVSFWGGVKKRGEIL